MESAMKAQGPELFGELVQFLERVCKDAKWDKCKKVVVEKEMKVNAEEIRIAEKNRLAEEKRAVEEKRITEEKRLVEEKRVAE